MNTPVSTSHPQGIPSLQHELPPGCIPAHAAFARCAPAERPLMGRYGHGIYPMEFFITAFEDREITPSDLSPERWQPIYELAWERSGLMWGDLLHWESPLNGFPWMEAIAGCPVYARRESRSVWAAERPGFRLEMEIGFDSENPWYLALLENTRALVEFSAGRFPVAPGILRGISDLMSSLLGANAFYLAFHDRPEAAAALACRLADLWIKVVAGQYQEIPPFERGYSNAGLWLPGLCPVYQDDAAALISARSYEQVVGPHARRVLEAFPNPIMHLHSAGLQILPSILKTATPVVIEVNLDPSGPPVERLVPIFRHVQSRAPLEIFGSPEIIQMCTEQLDPAGLACLILEPEPEENHA